MNLDNANMEKDALIMDLQPHKKLSRSPINLRSIEALVKRMNHQQKNPMITELIYMKQNLGKNPLG